jgi:hypothetical protein
MGIYNDALRSGIIEAAVNDSHYLVRFDKFIGFTDGSTFPESLAVVPIAEMIGIVHGDDDMPMSWEFFDNPQQRAEYQAWLEAPPVDGRAQLRRLHYRRLSDAQ